MDTGRELRRHRLLDAQPAYGLPPVVQDGGTSYVTGPGGLPFGTDHGMAASLSGYGYVHANPISDWDPSGPWGLGDVSKGLEAIATKAATAVTDVHNWATTPVDAFNYGEGAAAGTNMDAWNWPTCKRAPIRMRVLLTKRGVRKRHNSRRSGQALGSPCWSVAMRGLA